MNEQWIAWQCLLHFCQYKYNQNLWIGLHQIAARTLTRKYEHYLTVFSLLHPPVFLLRKYMCICKVVITILLPNLR
jgi:hypothetical protein